VSVPQSDINESERGGWVAGSPTLSKLVFATTDSKLSGEETPTKSGYDLYEYSSEEEGLRQLNVNSKGLTIGTCGAKMVRGLEDGETERVDTQSSPHSISANGSRVFFEAVPGRVCGEDPNLYMREDGSETVDIGAYRFLAADANGDRLLLENLHGGEAVLYETGSKTVTPLPGLPAEAEMVVSNDLSTVYFDSSGISRYDVATKKLELVVGARGIRPAVLAAVSPEGRYLYIEAEDVGGLYAAGVAAAGNRGITYTGEGANGGQIFRYDSQDDSVLCVSCASPYNPAPELSSILAVGQNKPQINGGDVLNSSVSANGDYAFFMTPSALVPQDIDGEQAIEFGSLTDGLKNGEWPSLGGTSSPSDDVYEWRAYGVHGCAQLQGCLVLITDGRGGYMSLLLGTADEGRDVFIYTREKLVPEAQGRESNIYDARIEGGFAPPPRPTECEANSCVSPPSAPNDATPSSFTFTGLGNVLPATPSAGTPPAKTKKPKTKRKAAAKRKTGKRKTKSKAKARKGSSGTRQGVKR